MHFPKKQPFLVNFVQVNKNIASHHCICYNGKKVK